MDVYLWSPGDGVSQVPIEAAEEVTCIAFNATGDILAIAREDGSVLLQSPHETRARVLISPVVRDAIGALAWRPSRGTSSPLNEFLVIGTYDGQVILVDVTWSLDSFVVKVDKIGTWRDVHTDQVCGIAWSNDGLSFATGANDNRVCTYEMPMGTMGLQNQWETCHRWTHDAAVKALAFKSGKGGILATGHHRDDGTDCRWWGA